MAFTAFGAIYRATASLLPPVMDSIEAKAMMFAIPMQESRWDERRQIRGPARGMAQFELPGIRGVLNHKASKPLIRSVLDRLDYDYKPETSYIAIEHNDVLMLAYMRCLLWTVPQPLPERGEVEIAWEQYLFAWNPGAPRHATWGGFYANAWDMVLTA
jgi:hypothetical protein